jgi:class 3 adenylate cyclase
LLNYTRDIRFESFIYFGMATVFALFLAVDMASFHGEYFQEKALHLESEEKALRLRAQRDLEKSRGEILSHFMADSIVARFQDGESMADNLRNVLTPRRARVGILQADIRGYSALAQRLDPAMTATVLRSCYEPFVEEAQGVAQIKLIGDAIFLFVEESSLRGGETLADVVFRFGRALAARAERLNAENRVKDNSIQLRFGMAIHVGEVVVGNLSSDRCIDYTVIGEEVNLVARLEELTKNEVVFGFVGENGMLISEEATRLLSPPARDLVRPLNLPELGVQVRSFPRVLTISYLRAEQANA